jgi:hypothetical protein
MEAGKMKETIIQEPLVLRFDNESSTVINGQRVVQTEEQVKINEEGDRAFLRLIIPVELSTEKTFKITITTYDDQILDNDFQNVDCLNN